LVVIQKLPRTRFRDQGTFPVMILDADKPRLLLIVYIKEVV